MIRRPAQLLALTLLLVPVALADAHQAATSNGVTVKLHVDPKDAPLAREPATLEFTRVTARGGRFSWRRCRCRLEIVDSAGRTVAKRLMKRKSTTVVFPRAGVYRVRLSGRVSGARGRSFKVTFAVRAY